MVRDTSREQTVVLRLCCVSDDEAIARLASLEGRPVPSGRHVVAEVDGTIVAALPLECGEPLADPFRRTAHLFRLLELRAAEIGTNCPPRRSWSALLSPMRTLIPARR